MRRFGASTHHCGGSWVQASTGHAECRVVSVVVCAGRGKAWSLGRSRGGHLGDLVLHQRASAQHVSLWMHSWVSVGAVRRSRTRWLKGRLYSKLQLVIKLLSKETHQWLFLRPQEPSRTFSDRCQTLFLPDREVECRISCYRQPGFSFAQIKQTFLAFLWKMFVSFASALFLPLSLFKSSLEDIEFLLKFNKIEFWIFLNLLIFFFLREEEGERNISWLAP